MFARIRPCVEDTPGCQRYLADKLGATDFRPHSQFSKKHMERVPTVSGTANLLDILDRVLDKGLVIAGDIRVSLANVELLTIRIRLLVCSVDKAEEIGLNWWKFDPNLTHPGGAARGASQAFTTRRTGKGVAAPAFRPSGRDGEEG